MLHLPPYIIQIQFSYFLQNKRIDLLQNHIAQLEAFNEWATTKLDEVTVILQGLHRTNSDHRDSLQVLRRLLGVAHDTLDLVKQNKGRTLFGEAGDTGQSGTLGDKGM